MGLNLLLKRIRKLAVAATSPRQLRALCFERVLASNEHSPVIFDDLRTVIDIGANRGQFALAVRSRLPRARIVSFEPLPGPAEVFVRVFANDALTQLHRCAVGARHERLRMNVAARDDSSSLLQSSETQTSSYPGTQTVDVTEVTVMPLDEPLGGAPLKRPALLKIDVQGAEMDVLLGCGNRLADFDWIYCECSFVELYRGQRLASEIVAWLHEHGFDLAGIHNLDSDRAGRALQADFLFRARAPR